MAYALYILILEEVSLPLLKSISVHRLTACIAHLPCCLSSMRPAMQQFWDGQELLHSMVSTDKSISDTAPLN
jgi:hypothetical protein